MSKKPYYIKVGSGEILPEKTIGEFELTIEATSEEVNHLEKLFEQIDHEAFSGFIRAHIPYMEYHHDKTNDSYDDILSDIYQFIYQCGTPETKKHIKSMGILNN